VAAVVLVGLTIFGYVSIAPNGRLEPGRPHLHRTDFTVFTEAGAAFFDGRDPYRVANPRGWHYLYPPLFALLVAPLTVFDTASQVVIWYVLNIGFAFGCGCELRRLWRFVGADELPRSATVIGCTFLATVLPMLDCMQAGQLGLGILYLLLLGFRLVVEGRSRWSWFLGGVILALPAVIKLVPSLPVAFLVFQQWSAVAKPQSGPRPWARATTLTAGVLTGVLLFLLVVPASLIGWRANLAHLDNWRTRVVANERVGPRSNFNIHSFRNQSLANAVYLWDEATGRLLGRDTDAKPMRYRPERIAHPSVRVVIGVILATLLLIGGLIGRRNDRLAQAAAYGLACGATLLVSPISWGHYFMVEAPAVLFAPLWLLYRGRPGQAGVVALIPPVLSWTYYVAMPYTGGIGILGLGTTIWFLTVCGLMLGNELVDARASSVARRQTRPAIARKPHFVLNAPTGYEPTVSGISAEARSANRRLR
jgi:hypothetical protein